MFFISNLFIVKYLKSFVNLTIQNKTNFYYFNYFKIFINFKMYNIIRSAYHSKYNKDVKKY